MPSKYRQRRQKYKEKYKNNEAKMKYTSKVAYSNNAKTVKDRSKDRNRVDKTLRKKHALYVKVRMEEDTIYKEKHKEAARLSQQKRQKLNREKVKEKNRNYKAERLTDPMKRKQHRLADRESHIQRLQDPMKKSKHTTMNCEGQKKRLRDDIKRTSHNIMNCEGQKKRLQDNIKRERQREINRYRQQSRRQTDKQYCIKNRMSTIIRLKLSQKYREQNKARAQRRMQQVSKLSSYKIKNRVRMELKRRNDCCELPVPPNRRQGLLQQDQLCHRRKVKKSLYTTRQKYWLRRSKHLSLARLQQRTLAKQKKMSARSSINLLDVGLLFNRAEQIIRKGELKSKQLHSKVTEYAEYSIQYLPTDDTLTESDITRAFGNLRIHNSSGEPYFWELSYKTLSIIECQSIAVDNRGLAHVFEPVVVNKPSTSPADNQTEDCHTGSTDVTHLPPDVPMQTNMSIKNWHCHPQLCSITEENMKSTVNLLKSIVATSSTECTEFYLQLDSCSCRSKTAKLGHTVHCSPLFCDSLLRPARTLSCHYPQLRSLVRRLYENRRLIRHIDSVKTAMTTGHFDELKAAVEVLDDILNRLVNVSTTDTTNKNNDCVDTDIVAVDEETVMQKYGKSLRLVAQLRDNYNTQSCDICEQLRKDISSLKSYEGRKGFDSEKMTGVIDLLYQYKTQYEDIDKFLDTTFICRYCADKLKCNRDVARSAFNCLRVVPTPDCIEQLNIFERILIKFTMTCLTVVRLGQVTNKTRPTRELTTALKGRIAYLPVDVSANASFLPENLLNVDNLVLLVGGQPTQQKRIWTSAVDLTKVHAALCWLKDNNRLYKDVPAYTIEDIKTIISSRQEGVDRQLTNNTNSDQALLKKLDEASKSFLYENFSIQPLSTSVPQDILMDYQLSKVNGQSGDVFDTDLDLKAYPELFPTGENGMRDAWRVVKIGTSDYIKSRLLNKNSKFRLNMNYLFHCFQTQEISNMCHSIGHMLRTVTGKSLTAKAFSDRLNNRDGEMQTNMFGLMANIRGSKEYFSRLAMNIKWMMKSIGPPTLFITCSTAEWMSPPFLDYLRTINHDCIANVDSMTAAELCAMDPVSVSQHFHQKWTAIFNHLIRQGEIFGTVQDYFWRIEYQARGAPHVHCVLWTSGPVMGKDSPEEVQRYIESIMTCSKPNSASSPTLSSLVSRFQEHKCNRYCMKSYKRNGKFYKKCRFGFPRPIKTEFQLNDIIDCLAVNKTNQPRKRLYHLKRSQDEVRINDYNPALLMANQANVDIQFIGHLGSRLPYYITDYMTKHERSEQDEMWKEIFTSSKSLGTNAMSFMLKSIKSRQVGANEAADRLLGHKLYSCSRQMRFADLQPASKAKRVLKPAIELNRLLEIDPESESIFQPHWVLDVYPDRPDELETSSVHNLLAWYEREKSTGKTNEQLKLRTLPMHLRRRRNTPYIITHQLANPLQSEEKKELYSYYMLKLFKPWRKEENLQLEGKTYAETFSLLKDDLPEMVSYHERNVRMTQQETDIDKAIKDRAQQQQAEGNMEMEEDEEGAAQGCVTDHLQTAMQELLDAHQRTMNQETSDDLQEAYNSLNTDQKRVVDLVVNKLCQDQGPIRLFVSGPGGTGKSRVIHVLQRLVSQQCGAGTALPVVVAAPTGLAAFNIGGTTIHRVFSLPVEHGKPADYNPLNADQLTMLRATLRGLKLLIIDEVSMMSSLTLLYIHLRLSEILTSHELFGGLSVVFFADLLQLPPVKGNQPFIPVTFLEAKQRVGSIASLDIWQTFTYDELTINMRQRGDEQYADLLSKVRVGQITDQQHSLLKERLISPGRRATVDEISRRYQQLVDEGQTPLILMPTTALCNNINDAMLKQIGNEIIRLEAVDTLETIVTKHLISKVESAYKKMEEDVTRTAGLEKTLQLCIGARIMLKRNKDVDAGLVNGAVGTVVAFDTVQQESQPTVTRIQIKFDTINGPIGIIRESSSFEVLKSVYYTRRQFPIMTAFAITVHKSQGLSLQSAIVDAGSATFGPGMIYVGLSRVTTLKGLHLVEFDRRKVKCDKKAITEYNRLRGMYTPHLGELHVTAYVSSAENHTSSSPTNIEHQSNTETTDQSVIPQAQAAIKTKKHAQNKSESRQTTQKQNTAQLPALQECPVFQFCSVQSIDSQFQKSTCNRLNFAFSTGELATTPCAERLVTKQLQSAINRQTQQKAMVHIFQVAGDGNCLFRALALAITGSQNQHELMRSYIVNHMMDEDVRGEMEQLFLMQHQGETYDSHLSNMQETGFWGTDQEIVAAANLFNVSVLCYSRYNNKLRLQHFSPHFSTDPDCSNACMHQTVYLINSNGTHYNMATVAVDNNETEE